MTVSQEITTTTAESINSALGIMQEVLEGYLRVANHGGESDGFYIWLGSSEQVPTFRSTPEKWPYIKQTLRFMATKFHCRLEDRMDEQAKREDPNFFFRFERPIQRADKEHMRNYARILKNRLPEWAAEIEARCQSVPAS